MQFSLRQTSSLLVASALLGLSVGCATSSHSTVPAASMPPGQIDAAALYQQNCAKCHGKTGQTRTVRGVLMGAQNLTDPDWQGISSTKQIVSAIKRGPGAMPAFEKKLSPPEIDALAVYVVSLPVTK